VSPEQGGPKVARSAKVLSPEEKREIALIAAADMEAWADQQIKRLNGQDRPIYHGGPGREREIVWESAIEAFLELKALSIAHAAELRGDKPLIT
jgi:hypothetical protein